jgi:transposase, IS6 family
MILSAIAEKLKHRSKDDFTGRHFQASLILQAVSWYLRYTLSYRDIEELFRERGLAVNHAALNRWPMRRCSSAGWDPSASRTAGRFALTRA